MPASIKVSPGFLTEFKEKIICERLAGRVGVIVKAKNGHVVVLKSPDVIRIIEKPERKGNLFILGIAGSFSERRDFALEYAQFEGWLKTSFSERDLNIYLAHDFITSLLKRKFYSYNPEPTALEFFVGDSKNDEASLLIVGFNGESRVILKNESNFEIIGCTGLTDGRKEKEKLKERLIMRPNLAELSVEEVRTRLEGFLEPFPGTLFSLLMKYRISHE